MVLQNVVYEYIELSLLLTLLFCSCYRYLKKRMDKFKNYAPQHKNHPQILIKFLENVSFL
jgi:hypothetical protein